MSGYRILPFALTLVLGIGASASASALNAWAPLAPMPTARYDLGTATGGDGRIYAIGGYGSDGSPLTSVEAYNPRSNTWTTRTRLPVLRAPRDVLPLGVVAGSDGRIYVAGGGDPCAPMNRVDAYSPSRNTWTTVAPMPTRRTGLATARGADGTVYAIGGMNECPGDGARFALETVEAYNPHTNRWRSVRPLPTARREAIAVTGSDGHIYVMGGYGEHDELIKTEVVAYNPGTNQWTQVAAMPTFRVGFAAAASHDGRIYVFGGYIATCAAKCTSLRLRPGRVEVYDIGTNTWTRTDTTFPARAGLAAVTGLDGRVYAIGGTVRCCRDAGSGAVNTVTAYTP